VALHLLAGSFSVSHLYARLRARFFDRAYAPPAVIFEALAAATFYAIAAVLQQSAASEMPTGHALRPGLLLTLLRRPRWLIGSFASVAGFAFQFLALRRGSLALVEPLLVASLVIALPLGAALEHRRLRSSEWAAGLLIFGALALFLLAAEPGRGHPQAGTFAWILLGFLTVAAVAACVRFSGASGPRRALLLGASAGILFGVTGAVTETTGHVLDHGLLAATSNWAPYALIVASVTGLLLNQSAFQVGQLGWSLPVITIFEPLVAIAIGELMFGEHIDTGPVARTSELLALAGMVVGVLILSRRPPPAARASG
jgi:drug/metabolite transporter (DMT)-like permease